MSPLHFALSLGPLAQTIPWSSLISPILIDGTQHCISLYADDILLFVENAAQSITHVLSIFDQFSGILGYRINWSKSALMPLDGAMRSTTLSPLISLLKQFKYLGIEIFPSLQSIIKHNFENTLSNICLDLNR